jgi:hypothetical protein
VAEPTPPSAGAFRTVTRWSIFNIMGAAWLGSRAVPA